MVFQKKNVGIKKVNIMKKKPNKIVYYESGNIKKEILMEEDKSY